MKVFTWQYKNSAEIRDKAIPDAQRKGEWGKAATLHERAAKLERQGK